MNENLMTNLISWLDDDKAIYPTTGTKRFFAKLIDVLIVLVINFILSLIFYYVVLGTDGYFNGSGTTTINIDQWDIGFMLIQTASLLTWITVLIIIPLFNTKNKGQSLGKMALSVTPLYLDKGNKNVKIVLRELPLIIYFAFNNIMMLITGYNFYGLSLNMQLKTV